MQRTAGLQQERREAATLCIEIEISHTFHPKHFGVWVLFRRLGEVLFFSLRVQAGIRLSAWFQRHF